MTASTSSTMITIDSSVQKSHEKSQKMMSPSSFSKQNILAPSAGTSPGLNLKEKNDEKQTENNSSQNISHKPFKRYTGRLKSGNLKSITTPLAKSEEDLLKSQLKDHLSLSPSPPVPLGLPKNFSSTIKATQNSKSLLEYDRNGNVVHVARIPSAELPKLHRSKPDFKIEDKEMNKKTTKEEKNQST